MYRVFGGASQSLLRNIKARNVPSELRQKYSVPALAHGHVKGLARSEVSNCRFKKPILFLRPIRAPKKTIEDSPREGRVLRGDSDYLQHQPPTRDDNRDHSVVAGDGSFKSDNLRSGESFTFKFEKAGKFAYGCGYHPRMKGNIAVIE